MKWLWSKIIKNGPLITTHTCLCRRGTPHHSYAPPGHAHPPRVSGTACELLLLSWAAKFSKRLTLLGGPQNISPLFTRKDFRSSLDKGDLNAFADYDFGWTCDLRATYDTDFALLWLLAAYCVRPARLLAQANPLQLDATACPRIFSGMSCFPLSRGWQPVGTLSECLQFWCLSSLFSSWGA